MMSVVEGEQTAPELIDVKILDDTAQRVGLYSVLGVAAEQGANTLTAYRALRAFELAHEIEGNPDYQSWALVGKFVVAALTDGEGHLARFGRKLQGKDESVARPLNAYADHLADKVLVNKTMHAIATREIENGNVIYGKTIKIAHDVTLARDVLTTIDRMIADRQGLDTRAQKAGKMKALKQYFTLAIALSPIAKSKLTKALVGTAFAYTAKESITSGFSLHASFRQQRKSVKT